MKMKMSGYGGERDLFSDLPTKTQYAHRIHIRTTQINQDHNKYCSHNTQRESDPTSIALTTAHNTDTEKATRQLLLSQPHTERNQHHNNYCSHNNTHREYNNTTFALTTTIFLSNDYYKTKQRMIVEVIVLCGAVAIVYYCCVGACAGKLWLSIMK